MKYINHKIRSGGGYSGSIRANKLYGINGGQVREGSPTRADMAVNLISKTAGTVTKRNGFTKKTLPFDITGKADAVAIYDAYMLRYTIYLSGGMLYSVEKNNVYSHTLPFPTDGMRPVRIGNYQFFIGGGNLIIYNPFIDEIMYWSKAGVGGATYAAYIPTIYIANTPDGAGASYEGVNMLCEKVCELYGGDGNKKAFRTHLEIFGGAEGYVKTDSGEWTRVEIESFEENTVTFKNAPPESQVEGEDNVKIVYIYKIEEPLWKKLAGCNNFCIFGVGGNRDRLFLSGNIAYPGCVYYSSLDNPLFFCDLDYIKTGDSETDVCSLAYYGSHLAVIADDGIYTVKGSGANEGAIKQDAMFLIDSFLATPPPVANEPSLIFGGEPVYLTYDGVYAVGASGVLDERCAALRSLRINELLINEDLKNCRMAVWGDRLVISNCKDTLYLLDSRQFYASEAEPFSKKQYEGFVWTGIDAKTLWTEDDTLYFSNDGGVFAFDGGYADETDYGVFVPIDAYWLTPYLYGDDLSGVKIFNTLSLLCDGGDNENSNVKISARFDNAPWIDLKDYDAKMRVFGYGDFDYSLFTYRGYVYSYALNTALSHKRGTGIKLKFRNDRLNEPFTMIRFNVDYLK